MKYIYISLLVSYSIFSSGQEVMTLPKAIAIALENNFQTKVTEQQIIIEDRNDTWARAGALPTVDLVGQFTNNLVNDNNPASFLQGTYYSGSLGASANADWVLYSGGRIKINKELLGKTTGQLKYTRASDIHTLLREVYQQYYEVLFQQEQLEVLSQVLALSKDRLSYEDTKRAYGVSNTFNLIQFKSSVLADSNAIINQRQLVETAKQTLYTTLDMQEISDYQFDERLSIIPEEIDEAKLKEVMNKNNFRIMGLRLLAGVNKLNTGLAKAANKPVLSLNGTIGFAKNGFKFFADDPNTGDPFDFLTSTRLTGQFNANLSYNLYDGGVRSTDIQNAQLQEEIDQMNILDARVELNNQLDLLIDNYDNQLRVLELTNEQINLAQQNLEIAEERFKAGQISSLDYRNIQTQYLNAAYSKVGAIYSLLITKSEIDFLTGVFGN